MKMKHLYSFSLILICLLSPTFITQASSRYQDDTRDRVISAFEEVLDRRPSRSELREYTDLATERRLSYNRLVRQIERDYADRRGSSRPGLRTGSGRGSAVSDFEARRWVESLFTEYVGRLPNEREFYGYTDLAVSERLDRRQLASIISEDYHGQFDPHGLRGDYRYRFNRYSMGDEAEIIIREAYLDILEREPDLKGLRNYRIMLIDRGWSECRLRDHLANSPEALHGRLSIMIERAYSDLLEREPNSRELDDWVDQMIRNNWDERRLRDQIRRSHEFQHTRPRRMIELAYREVLLREPDSQAFQGLQREIVRREWNLEQVREHLRKSDEYRNVTIPKMVRLAYSEVLDREPDNQGYQLYLTRARQGWTLEMIMDDMRKSEEYRNKRRSNR